MANFYYETCDGGRKTLDWDAIPPGEYKMVNNTIVAVGVGRTQTDLAADNFISALRRLAT
jgi:hypothetical protein